MKLPSNKELAISEHQKLSAFLKDSYSSPIKKDIINAIIEEVNSLKKFSLNSNTRFYVLWDHVSFLPVYISSNVLITGFTAEEICSMTLLQGITKLHWKQLPWIRKAYRDSRAFRQLAKSPSMQNFEFIYCGIKLIDKQKKHRIFLNKQKILMADKAGNPLLSFNEATEITPHYTGKGGWCQATDYANPTQLKRIFFYPKEGSSKELLTNQELRILHLIIQKMGSYAIANHLQISRETVKKHRKNMLAKVGAKDMTALIYICQLANII